MKAGLAILLLALAAGGVRAQEAPVTTAPGLAVGDPAAGPSADPIGDAIAASLPPDQSTDMDSDAPPRVDAPPVATAPPSVYAPPRRPALDRPVMVDETGKNPDAPPTPVDIGYESRIRASASAAQGLQGPLDGGWTVRSAYGVAVLSLQLVDRGQGYGQLEGAWRSLDGPVGKVGLIDSLDRQPVILIIRITKSPGKPTVVLTLAPASDGGWAGEIVDEWGVHPVTMRRN
ncbi:MAG: hypothetical protein Q8L23_13815 [Caulobacter sp.]|nr:hypothetical protein [Caulobacter sp.]